MFGLELLTHFLFESCKWKRIASGHWLFFTKLFAVQKKDIGLCKKNKKMCFVYFLATISEITFALSSLKNIFVFTQKKQERKWWILDKQIWYGIFKNFFWWTNKKHAILRNVENVWAELLSIRLMVQCLIGKCNIHEKLLNDKVNIKQFVCL